MEKDETKRLECEIDKVGNEVVVKIKDLNLELVFPSYEFINIVRKFQKHYGNSDYDY